MPPKNPKEPCPCPKCGGAYRAHKTVLKHRKAYPDAFSQVPTFDAWRGGPMLPSVQQAVATGSQKEVESRGPSPETEDEDERRASGSEERSGAKRRRIDYDNDMRVEDLSEDERPPSRHDSEISARQTPNPSPEHELPQPRASTPDLEIDEEEYEENERDEPQNENEDEDDEPGAENEQEDELDPPPPQNAEEPARLSCIDHVRLAQELTREISEATLDNGRLDQATIQRLRSPAEGPIPEVDADLRLSIDLFFACRNASEATYTSACEAIMKRFPECELLSYKGVKEWVANTSGIVAVADDMCIKGCHAFVGPMAHLDACAECGEARYDPVELERSGKRVPQQQACTIPLGPQIQALRRSPEGAQALRYRDEKTQQIIDALNEINEENPDPELAALLMTYDDIFSGSDYLDLAEKLDLTEDDTTVLFSVDGAQLYLSKQSDTWIAIWVVLDYDPKTRYRKRRCLPALIIPGPNKPQNIDTYLFRSFHHLSALQHENNGAGIKVWDAVKNAVVLSRIIFILGTADAVALTELDGRVGHHGAHGCRLGCEMKGRHKANSGHYYSVHLRPHNPQNNDSSHPDFDFQDPNIGMDRATPVTYANNIETIISSNDQHAYETNRKLTGLSKPSILSGLSSTLSLPVPLCFSVDLMHLLYLNIGKLFIQLWRGSIKCDATDDKTTWDWVCMTGDAWTTHGQLVANATQYFPAFFHRPPRNPAKKINSGFKATEWDLYFFKLGPGFFRAILPNKYWRHYCKLIHGVSAITQRSITGKQLREAHKFLCEFVQEYETLYYQRRSDRMQFCYPCIHTLLHLAPEVARIGPGAYFTQFTLEHTIGDLGGAIHQHATPFANLVQISLRLAQANALKVIDPSFDSASESSLPQNAHLLDDGLALLRPRTKKPISLPAIEVAAISAVAPIASVRKWGRLRLANGQIARSVFSESRRNAPNSRNTRNIKAKVNGLYIFCEVQYYFLHEVDDENFAAFALVSQYSDPDPVLWEQSYHTLHVCQYQGNAHLICLPVQSIISVISMQPLPKKTGDVMDLFFVVEKSGLTDMSNIV
ncbi:hypothetical protein CVT24_001144 [Panaeolus cyanescens]|uniref:Uncharacterized protein n=1 Tax=Panaeolus cyanescens TaxID=181874 RepID=A0A409WS72_9AGAR|nr:hypothetical protein CVT24_001144 [Panaeolus cyanescens]